MKLHLNCKLNNFGQFVDLEPNPGVSGLSRVRIISGEIWIDPDLSWPFFKRIFRFPDGFALFEEKKKNLNNF